MGSLRPVVYGSARAITVSEFYEALQALTAQSTKARNDAQRCLLAVSGGVDSMALAYLCSRSLKRYPVVSIDGSPISSFHAAIVDHQIREGSDEEAKNVQRVLTEILGIRSTIVDLRHASRLPGVLSSAQRASVQAGNLEAAGFETLARGLRYRLIGEIALRLQACGILVGHHEDDQYETILMRLLRGHGHHGLQGMAGATDIPECYGIHGMHRSDSLRRNDPNCKSNSPTGVPKGYRRQLAQDLEGVPGWAAIAGEARASGSLSMEWQYLPETQKSNSKKWAPPLRPVQIEEGGLQVYRPLLGFTKERLVATCVENKIPWFEDPTNSDSSLTPRNSIRHMVQNHKLPVALQKPAVLAMAQRCRDKAARQKAEVDRWIARLWIRDFEPHAGTVTVELPKFAFPRATRMSSRSPRGHELRKKHYRRVARALILRIMSLVSPEKDLMPPERLDMVSRLFPSIAEAESSSSPAPPPTPKAFTTGGVHFLPLINENHPLRWSLCRAPHPKKPTGSEPPLAMFRYPGFTPGRHQLERATGIWTMSNWQSFRLFDHRWWVRVRHRFPFRIYFAPFREDRSRAFRDRLGSDEAREDLERRLRKYAPGKIRWTLPAIYAEREPTPFMTEDESEYFPEDLQYRGRFQEPEPEFPGGGESEINDWKLRHSEWDQSRKAAWADLRRLRMEWEWRRQDGWRKELEAQGLRVADVGTIVSLPTLDVAIPGLDKYLECEVRYQRLDPALLRRFQDLEDREAMGGLRER